MFGSPSFKCHPVKLKSELRSGVVACALFCLLMSGFIQAADNHETVAPRPLDIHVQPNGFGKVNPADITAVLQTAGFEIWRHCRRTQLDGIDVYHRSDHPQTDFNRTPNGRISIGLASQDTYWAQYSFQFAHEFCHTLANFSNNPGRSARHPPIANFWLEESLCETASLFTLRAMSRSWIIAPSFPAWRDYAPSFTAYVEERLTAPEFHLPAGMPFSVWFQENQLALRQNPFLRDRNTIVALQLLSSFEAEPRGWEAIAFLNRGSSDPNQNLARHLAEWYSACPSDLRSFVRRLAAVFAVKI